MADEKVHRGYGKLYAKFIHRFSRLSYYLFASGENFSDLVLNMIDFKKSERILDIGCGVGSLLFDIHKSLKFKNKDSKRLMIGMDRSKEMIKIALKRVRENEKEVLFLICDASDMPFKSNAFDICFNVLLLHHLPPQSKIRVMNETCRILSNKGACVIMDLDNPSSIIGWFIALSRWYVSTIRTNFQYGLKHFFTEAGMRVEAHIKKLGIFSYYRVRKINI